MGQKPFLSDIHQTTGMLSQHPLDDRPVRTRYVRLDKVDTNTIDIGKGLIINQSFHLRIDLHQVTSTA